MKTLIGSLLLMVLSTSNAFAGLNKSPLKVKFSGLVTTQHLGPVALDLLDASVSEHEVVVALPTLEKSDSCVAKIAERVRSDIEFAQTVYSTRVNAPGLLEIQIEQIIDENAILPDGKKYMVHYSISSLGGYAITSQSRARCSFHGTKVEVLPSQFLDITLR